MAKPDWRCGAARGLPINRGRDWDGPAAAKRMLDAAGIGGKHPDPDRAKRGFLLYDAANGDLRGSYKLPFADLVDGRLTAYASGIRAAASRLPQTDAPERERERARLIIDDYERRMADEDKRKTNGKSRENGASIRAPMTRGAAHMLPHLAQRVLNTPLALHPTKAEVIVAALADRLGVARIVRADGSAAPLAAALDEVDTGAQRGYEVVAGAAIIPVRGTLVHRLGAVQPVSGMTGYDGIRENLATALADPEVRGIVLDIDSPGGEVAGMFGLVDDIFAARARKPSLAIVDEAAYSAGYALASACGSIACPRSGGVGSVGIIAVRTDISRALDKGGVTVNVIQFGAQKADTLEAVPLPDDARARFQADVDAMGLLFVEAVARNRGLRPEVVRATEAGTFLGPEARAHGLIDSVAEPAAAFDAFVRSL